MGKFKKGFFFGALLGTGLMWMNTTQKGRQAKEQLVDHAAEVYAGVKDKVMESGAWEKMTKQGFVAAVRDAVDAYGKDHKMAKQTKEFLVKLVSTQWSNLQKEIKKRR